MLLEPKFDDPSRVADYGYFSWERRPAPKITKDTLADAIETGIEPKGAPFRDWIPLLFEGWRFDVNPEEGRQIFKVMLNHDDTCSIAMDILCDIAFEKYGADNE